MGRCMEYMLFHAPKVPKGYRDIVERCLRKKGKEYFGAEQIYRDLEKIQHRKPKEKAKEVWYAVTGVLSEQDGSMAALQLAMYLKDRYRKKILLLDCTQEHLMEHLELSDNLLEKTRGQGSFVFERNGITVAKRVAPQEVSGWRNRGYAFVIICLGKQSPLLSGCLFKECIFAGAVTELSLNQWQNMLLPMGKATKTAVALTGGDIGLARQTFGKNCCVTEVSTYFRAFKTSKPYRRQMKRLLGGK